MMIFKTSIGSWVPKWILPLNIVHEYPIRENDETFYEHIGVKMSQSWYQFYFDTLGTTKVGLNGARYFSPLIELK